jgi:hypothetical protein
MTTTLDRIPRSSARTTLPRAANRLSSGLSSASRTKRTTTRTERHEQSAAEGDPADDEEAEGHADGRHEEGPQRPPRLGEERAAGYPVLGLAVAGGPARVGQVRRTVRHGDIHTNVSLPGTGTRRTAGSSLAFGTTALPPANPDGASMTQPDASAPAPRNVLVTGGNRGIGLAIARAFVEGGDNVVITNRKGDAPDGLRAVKCEVTDTESVNAALRRGGAAAGRTHRGAVANAGITRDTLLMRMSDEEFDDVIATNLAGALQVRAAARARA